MCRALALALVVVGSTPPAAACSVCGCGDPLVAAGAGIGLGGELRLGLSAESLSVTSGSETVAGRSDTLDQQSMRALAVWSPVDNANLTLTLPVVHKRLSAATSSSVPETTDLTGLGDVELAASWYPWDSSELGARRRQGLALTVGLTLPTGNSDATADGARIDEHGQLGTGSFGPSVGMLYRLRQDPFGLVVGVTGRYHTENGHQYRYGASLQWTLEAQWEPGDRLAFGLGLDGRRAAADTDAGLAVASTGGTLLALSPSGYVRVVEDLWLTARVQVPVYSALRGEQSVRPTYLLGLQYQVL